jgi:hypothetical protein
LRIAAGYAWTDYTTDTEIAKEINITSLLGKIQECRRNWLQHINRTARNKLPGILKTTEQQALETRSNKLTL